ncbi:MAG TPA: hypothetical protein VNQ76_22240 [Planctomicrobium sp.]|nr:hypothetical protein [Planctomicrobium sp.]
MNLTNEFQRDADQKIRAIRFIRGSFFSPDQTRKNKANGGSNAPIRLHLIE